MLQGLDYDIDSNPLSIFIETCWKQEPFTLITGKGLHSDSRELYEMREFMLEKIRNHFPQLIANLDQNNAGRILIDNQAEGTASYI